MERRRFQIAGFESNPWSSTQCNAVERDGEDFAGVWYNSKHAVRERDPKEDVEATCGRRGGFKDERGHVNETCQGLDQRMAIGYSEERGNYFYVRPTDVNEDAENAIGDINTNNLYSKLQKEQEAVGGGVAYTTVVFDSRPGMDSNYQHTNHRALAGCDAEEEANIVYSDVQNASRPISGAGSNHGGFEFSVGVDSEAAPGTKEALYSKVNKEKKAFVE